MSRHFAENPLNDNFALRGFARCGGVLLLACAVLAHSFGSSIVDFSGIRGISSHTTVAGPSCGCCCARKGITCSCGHCALSLTYKKVKTKVAKDTTPQIPSDESPTIGVTQWLSCPCDGPVGSKITFAGSDWFSPPFRLAVGFVNVGRLTAYTDPRDSRQAPQPPTPPPRCSSC